MLEILLLNLEKVEKIIKVFENVKKHIVGDEKAAAEDLKEVSDELIKFLQATQTEISNLQALDLSSSAGKAASRRVLFDLQSGLMGPRIAAASGSCQKIDFIYRNNLSPFFRRILKNFVTEFDETEKTFSEMTNFDTSIIAATKELEDYLSPIANKLFNMMDVEDPALMSYHNQISKDLTPIRVALNKNVVMFLNLRNEFEKMAS